MKNERSIPMSDYNCTAICNQSEACFFIGVYKDRLEDTWFNVCFVNNSAKGIKYMKVESAELQYSGEGYSKVLTAASCEYEHIYSGEYLLLEKLDSLDERVDEYKYSFTIDMEEKLINLKSIFSRSDLSKESFKTIIPVIKENGRVYLCA